MLYPRDEFDKISNYGNNWDSYFPKARFELHSNTPNPRLFFQAVLRKFWGVLTAKVIYVELFERSNTFVEEGRTK